MYFKIALLVALATCCFADTCSFRGQEFNAKDELITKDCKYKCKCTIKDGKKSVSCSGLCGGVSVSCGVGEEIKYEDVKVKGTKCSCRQPVCKKAAPKPLEEVICSFRGQKFKASESLVTKDCKYRCKCTVKDGLRSVSCGGLCGASSVSCDYGEKIVYKKVKQEGTKCSCRKPVCVKRPKEEISCHYKGLTMKHGESSITKDCKWRCGCKTDGGKASISCASLCPNWSIKCGKMKTVYDESEVKGSKCKCKKPRCA